MEGCCPKEGPGAEPPPNVLSGAGPPEIPVTAPSQVPRSPVPALLHREGKPSRVVVEMK